MKIEPTIGRVIWYNAKREDFSSDDAFREANDQMHAAIITYINDDGTVNVMAMSHKIIPAFPCMVIERVAIAQDRQAGLGECMWMPYQVGQAKKNAETVQPPAFPPTHEYAQIGNTVAITPIQSPTVKDIDDETLAGLIKATGQASGDKEMIFPVHLEGGSIHVNRFVLVAESQRRQNAKAPAFEGMILSLREKEVLQWAWNKLNEDPSSQYANVRERLSILQGIMNKCLIMIPSRDEAKAEDPALIKEQLTQAAEDWRSEAERLRAVLQEIAGATPLSTVNGLKMLADRALNPVKWRGRDQHQPTFSESVFSESDTPADVDAVRTLMRKAENYDRVIKWLDEVNAATHEFKDGDARELSLIQRIESGIARAAKQETPTASYETQDPKYNIVDCKLVNASTGNPIPHDEPIFIFRAQDMLSVAVLGYYMSIVTNSDHKGIVSLRLKQFCTFANEHRDRMKYPDTDPALAAVTVERGGSGAFKFHVGPLGKPFVESDEAQKTEMSFTVQQPDGSVVNIDGFTPWSGGTCPVNQNDVVDVVLRRGNTLYNNVAGNLCWLNDDVFSESSHIIGYKVTLPAPLTIADIPSEILIEACNMVRSGKYNNGQVKLKHLDAIVSATIDEIDIELKRRHAAAFPAHTDDNVFCGDVPALTIKDVKDTELAMAFKSLSNCLVGYSTFEDKGRVSVGADKAEITAEIMRRVALVDVQTQDAFDSFISKHTMKTASDIQADFDVVKFLACLTTAQVEDISHKIESSNSDEFQAYTSLNGQDVIFRATRKQVMDDLERRNTNGLDHMEAFKAKHLTTMPQTSPDLSGFSNGDLNDLCRSIKNAKLDSVVCKGLTITEADIWKEANKRGMN